MKATKTPPTRLLAIAALLAALPAAASDITDLGTLKNDNSGISEAYAVNSDGSIVVGLASNDYNNASRAIVWSGSNWATKTDLGTLKSDNSGWSRVSAISHDGSVVAGQSKSDNGFDHAIVWSGSNWATKTNLGTLKADNSGRSIASGLSHDGLVVAGTASSDINYSRATVWSGSNWATKTDLGTLKTDNTGASSADAASGDGSLVFGQAENDNGDIHAIVWSGSNWGTKTDLGTLKSDNSGSSYAKAVSSDGSVVAGNSLNDNGELHAAVWSGSGWATKTDLGTLKTDNSGESYARAASGDGSTVGGEAENDNGDSHATVWSGSNWSTKTDLGTLKSDNSGYSTVYGISADGNFAVGRADDDNGNFRAAVWNLRGGRAADTANTRASLSLLSADTAAMLAQRARAAQTLLDTCRADGGKFCYSAGYTHDVGHGARSRGARFAFGYGFTDNFDAAVSLSAPFHADENRSHHLKSGTGLGISARLHNKDGWYVVPAAAFESDKTRISRPHLSGTENPVNNVRVKSRAYSLTFGQDLASGDKSYGWYAAVRRTEAKRPAYAEDAGLSFPFAYGAAELKETELAIGTKARLPLGSGLSWYGSAEIAQRVGGGKTRFTASAPFFGAFEEARETARTRPSVQTGVDYAFGPATAVSLGGYIGRNAFSGTDKGVFLKLDGKF